METGKDTKVYIQSNLPAEISYVRLEETYTTELEWIYSKALEGQGAKISALCGGEELSLMLYLAAWFKEVGDSMQVSTQSKKQLLIWGWIKKYVTQQTE